ncbi:MAG: hypothetical protein HRT77_12430 [Halioglobus sp.]|nr:hypothetical protein [Halioglobus sp.]
MTPGILDVHDTNLQLWYQGALVQSPGYAFYKANGYSFGATARAAARLQPRDINTRFWWRLNTESLQPALGPARHTADLVHAHLLQLHEQAGKPAELLLAVPGTMQHDQLALLLGIVQQCPFEAIGLVNRSVALGSLFDTAARLFHLEVQLHQAAVSELVARNNTVTLQQSIPLPGCGLLQLQERLVEVVAAEFVRQTRFDPRRQASTEQQLYNALPTALHSLRSGGDTNLDVNGYQARISAQQLEECGQRLFESASDAIGPLQPGDAVIADPLATLLPGLSGVSANLCVLQGEDIHVALQRHGAQVSQRSEALSLVRTLPMLRVKDTVAGNAFSSPPTEPAPPKQVLQPTHLLDGHLARPLHADGTELAKGYTLYQDRDGWQLRGSGSAVSINGAPWRESQILTSGDRITINGASPTRLIEVLP